MRFASYKALRNGRLLTWSIWFENFDISFEHIQRKKNFIADFITKEYAINMNRSDEWIE